MNHLLKIFMCLWLFQPAQAQVIFYQDTYKGGITSDGVSYAAQEYFSADSINFQLSIPATSTIRKAFLLTLRFPFIKGTLPKKDAPFKVKFNNTYISFDSSDIATNRFLCDYAPDASNWILAEDVSSLVQYTGNKLITVNQSILMNQDTSRHYLYAGYLLVVMYEDASMPVVNSVIFLNNQNFSTSMSHQLSGMNPIDSSKDVGLSIWAENVTSNPAGYTLSYTLNSSLGNYLLGTLDQYKGLTPQSKTLPGSFYYENGVLSGLVDDTPDPFIDSTDALANIKGYIANNATTFSLTSIGSSPVDCIDFRLASILAYSTPCSPFTNISEQYYKICGSGSVQLASVSNGNTYNWFQGGTLSDSTIANPLASPTVTSNYILTVTDSAGCHHSEHHKVSVYPLPKTSGITIAPAICGDVRGTATVTAAYAGTEPYLYNIGSGNQGSNIFSNLQPATYSLTITDSVGCIYQTAFAINEINTADASFIIQPDLLCEGQNPNVANTSGTVNNYSWYVNNVLISNSQYPSYSFADTGFYSVTLIAYHNLPQCADTVSHTLFVKECPPDSINVTVPNIFTPNGDEINDIWLPLIYQYGFVFESFEMTIYDRWGIKVFESTDTKKGWDGRTTSGIECSEGTYYYVISYYAKSALETKWGGLKGFVQLIR